MGLLYLYTACVRVTGIHVTVILSVYTLTDLIIHAIKSIHSSASPVHVIGYHKILANSHTSTVRTYASCTTLG